MLERSNERSDTLRPKTEKRNRLFVFKKMQTKLLVFLLLASLIPIIMFVIFFARNQAKVFTNESIKISEREVDRLMERLDIELRNVSSVTNALCVNDELHSAVSAYIEAEHTVAGESKESEITKILDKTYPYFYGNFYPKIYVITASGSIIGDPVYKNFLSANLDALPSTRECNSGKWVALNNGSGNYILYLHTIFDEQYVPDGSAVVATCFSSNSLSKTLFVSSEDSKSIYILNENRYILTSVDNLNLGEEMSFYSEESFLKFQDNLPMPKDGWNELRICIFPELSGVSMV